MRNKGLGQIVATMRVYCITAKLSPEDPKVAAEFVRRFRASICSADPKSAAATEFLQQTLYANVVQPILHAMKRQKVMSKGVAE